MTSQIIYSTTGGNTEFFVDNLAIGIRNQGISCITTRAEKADLESIGKFDLTILATPTYNVGKLPWSFQKLYDFVKSNNFKFPNKYMQGISLGRSEYYDVFCGSKKFLDEIISDLDSQKLSDTILIDGETFGRAEEFIQIGNEIGKKLLKTISDFVPEFKNLSKFFKPNSIAVVGASSDESKIGNQIFRNINEKFEGELYAVNKNAVEEKLYDRNLVKSISELPDDIDLIVLVVPNIAVISCINECIQKSFQNIVIIASGFKEIHTEVGEKLEKELNEIISQNNLNILGPNCLGFINSQISLNATFASSEIEMKPESHLAVISQSGAIITELLDKVKLNKLKFSKLISIGNKNSIDECDVYKYLLEDDDVETIFMYIEDIKNPQKFMNLLENTKVRKNTIILYPGNSKSAQSAILSHTGAFSTSHDFADLQFEKYGIIPAHSLQEVDLYLTFFSDSNKFQTDNFTILTNAGGPGVVLTDLMSENSLSLTKLSVETLVNLKEKIPMFAGTNPIDIVGDADYDRFENALEILTTAREVNILIFVVTPQSSTPLSRLGKLIIDTQKKTHKLILPILYGDEHFHDIKNEFTIAGIPYFTTDVDLIRILKILPRVNNTPDPTNEIKSTQTQKIYNTSKTTALLEKYNIPIPKYLEINNIADLHRFEIFKTEINSKVNKSKFVFKFDNSLSIHKTDMKGVFTNIDNLTQLTSIYKNWQKEFKTENIKAIIQEQFHFGLEIFCGIKKDIHPNGFGYMMIVGFGGIYTNIFNDFVKLAMPFSREDLEAKMSHLLVNKILDGARGKVPLDKSELIETILKIQNLILENDFILEADINPILVSENGVCVPDVKIYI